MKQNNELKEKMFLDEDLRQICLERAAELYGSPLPKRIRQRIEKEVSFLEEENLADDFYWLSRIFLKEPVAQKYQYLKGFRGPLGNSFVAYLCGVTNMNPMELPKEFWLYEEHFFQYVRGKEALCIHINVSRGLYEYLLEEGIMENCPLSIRFFCSPNLTLLEKLQEETGDIYMLYGNEEAVHKDPANIYFFFRNGSNMENLFEFHNSILARKVLPRCRLKNLNDLTRIIGLLHGSGTWYDEGEVPEAALCNGVGKSVSCVEDVYEYLKKHRVKEEQALEMAERVRCGKADITEDDIKYLKSRWCEDWFIERLGCLRYLFFRAQCLCYAMENKRLVYYYNHYTKLYRELYSSMKETNA